MYKIGIINHKGGVGKSTVCQNLAVCLTREVFKAAILANAASVVFFHNHPSGGTEPSNDDIEITKTEQALQSQHYSWN